MVLSYTYRDFEIVGYKENVEFDGMQFTIGVLNSTSDEYIFTESINITGTAIVILFGQRNGTGALNYLEELALSKAKARIDLGEYEQNGRYIQKINSESIKQSIDNVDEQFIAIKILTTLHNIRKLNPVGYKTDRLELKGFCNLYQVSQKLVLYLLSMLEEKQFIEITDIKNSQMYITVDGINYLDKIVNSSNLSQEPEQIKLLKEWDAFISHASEDKKNIAEPLAAELSNYGIKVWLDKSALKVGDNLREKIDEGLKLSRYGIVILSPAFMSKHWTNLELAGLFQKEAGKGGKKVILPVWHNIGYEEVEKYSLLLSGKVAITTNNGIDKIAKQLAEVILDTDIDEPTFKSTSAILGLDITYKKLNIGCYTHKYSLVVKVLLKCPPKQNSFRLSFLWPKIIKISKMENLRSGIEHKIDKQPYIEFFYEHNTAIYPGETLEVIGQNTPYRLEYIIDQDSWDLIKSNNINLEFTSYCDSLLPEKGVKNFNELNEF